MTEHSFPRLTQSSDRARSLGFTLLELLVVIVLVGLVSVLAVPSFVSPRSVPEDAVQRVIGQARRAAVRRAESVTLSFEPDGGWVLEGGGVGGSIPLRTGTLERSDGARMSLRISPLGACHLDVWEGPAPAPAIDPVGCRFRRP